MTRPAKNIPRHIAIIMDGNGRWAKQRGLLRAEGHRIGMESVRAMVRACRAPAGAGVFLEVGGERSEAIVLAANDLRRAREATRLGPNVPRSAVTNLP